MGAYYQVVDWSTILGLYGQGCYYLSIEYNIASSVSTFTEEIMEIAIYNANRNSKVNKAWEQFTNDLETIQEETDGR